MQIGTHILEGEAARGMEAGSHVHGLHNQWTGEPWQRCGG
jgi:hypothetical protein